MQHRDYIVLKKIIDEARIAQEMLGETTIEDFFDSNILKRAVSMSLINIGELVKTLTEEFRASYNYVPWKAIAGFRDIAAHKYQTLSMDLVYNTVKIDLSELILNIEKILNE